MIAEGRWISGKRRVFVGDARLIDGAPNGMAEIAAGSSRQVVKIQTGSIAVYAFTMLIGLVLLVSIFMVSRFL